MSQPAVSVIIPTFNRADLLPRALDSVVGQSFTDWEIVLIDDGSTDATAAVAARYARRVGRRLTYIRQENGGSSSARNTGIAACGGRFVAFLDSDDEFLPTKLQRQLALFELVPELGFVYCDYAFIDLAGIRHESAFDTRRPLARHVPYETVAPGLCACSGSLFDWLIRAYFIATIVGMVRRSVLGGEIRFREDLQYAEEWLFYLQVARVCRAGFVDEPLCLHHYVRGSLARTDKQRNTAGRYAVLRAVQDAFDDLDSAHRAALRGQLAQTCRQLGYDALRGGDNPQALRRFAESFRHRPRARVVREWVRAAASCIRRGGGSLRAPSRASQERSEVAR